MEPLLDLRLTAFKRHQGKLKKFKFRLKFLKNYELNDVSTVRQQQKAARYSSELDTLGEQVSDRTRGQVSTPGFLDT